MIRLKISIKKSVSLPKCTQNIRKMRSTSKKRIYTTEIDIAGQKFEMYVYTPRQIFILHN